MIKHRFKDLSDEDDDNGFEEAGFIPDPDDDGYGDFDEDIIHSIISVIRSVRSTGGGVSVNVCRDVALKMPSHNIKTSST